MSQHFAIIIDKWADRSTALERLVTLPLAAQTRLGATNFKLYPITRILILLHCQHKQHPLHYYARILYIFQSTSWALSCERQTQRIRKQFFSAILKQEIGWFDVHQSGELTSRLSGWV